MRWALSITLGLAAMAVGVSPARAAFTTINAPIFPEDNRQQIFSSLYTGTFSPTSPGSLNYTNGTITAVRIEDIYSPTETAPSIVASSGPINDDQVWNANFQLASAEAVFGQFHQEFGYFDGSTGGSYVKLFDANGMHYDVTGQADLSNLSGHTLRWARGGEGRVFSSKISDNIDQRDHMVTFRIDGLNDDKLTWLLMWEDKKTGEVHADFDFNDLVVKVTAVPTQVPEPMAIGPLAIAALLTLRRRPRAI